MSEILFLLIMKIHVYIYIYISPTDLGKGHGPPLAPSAYVHVKTNFYSVKKKKKKKRSPELSRGFGCITDPSDALTDDFSNEAVPANNQLEFSSDAEKDD